MTKFQNLKKVLLMHELICGLRILHMYTENVFIDEEFICVDVEGLYVSYDHERYLASYDWKFVDNIYKFELNTQ